MMADTEQHEAPSGAGAATRPLPCPGGGGQMAAFLIVAVMVGAFFRLMAPNIPDPDSFYHFRHAAVYAEKGITYSQFPWLVYSVVNRLSADLGYGFHLLLVPLTFLGDQVLGVKLGAVLETVITLTLLFLVLRRHRIAFCGVWPFAVFLLGPPMTYTFLMTRPQTLTMGLCALLFSLLVRGPAWGVLLAAGAICFFHLNVFVIVPVIVVIVALCKGLTGGGWEWRKWVAAAAGMGLGALLRPNPLGAMKLEYVQFLVHEMVRKEGIPLNFGREWLPVNLEGLVAGFSWFLTGDCRARRARGPRGRVPAVEQPGSVHPVLRGDGHVHQAGGSPVGGVLGDLRRADVLAAGSWKRGGGQTRAERGDQAGGGVCGGGAVGGDGWWRWPGRCSTSTSSARSGAATIRTGCRTQPSTSRSTPSPVTSY